MCAVWWNSIVYFPFCFLLIFCGYDFCYWWASVYLDVCQRRPWTKNCATSNIYIHCPLPVAIVIIITLKKKKSIEIKFFLILSYFPLYSRCFVAFCFWNSLFFLARACADLYAGPFLKNKCTSSYNKLNIKKKMASASLRFRAARTALDGLFVLIWQSSDSERRENKRKQQQHDGYSKKKSLNK